MGSHDIGYVAHRQVHDQLFSPLWLLQTIIHYFGPQGIAQQFPKYLAPPTCFNLLVLLKEVIQPDVALTEDGASLYMQ